MNRIWRLACSEHLNVRPTAVEVDGARDVVEYRCVAGHLSVIHRSERVGSRSTASSRQVLAVRHDRESSGS